MNFRNQYDRRPGRLCIALALLVLGGMGTLAASPAQAQAKKPVAPKVPASLVIYRGDSLQTSGVTLANWGSGQVDKDTQKVFSGTESLKVTTHGLYQGVSLSLANPVNLGTFLTNKYAYLQIAVLPPPPKDQATPGGFGPGGPGGPGGNYPGVGGQGGKLGSGDAGSPGSSGFPGSSGYGPAGRPATKVQKFRKLENLRVVLVTTGDKTVEVMLPLASAATDNEWKLLAIPVSRIPNLKADDAKIKEIRLFGDAPATLNVGSIGVVEDPTPINLNSINDKTVQRLAKYQYYATANAGVTPLVFSWDWDASDGIQNEAEGRNVTYTFRKASVDDAGSKNTDYVVTVTVSDLYGIKAPVKTSFKVHVTP